MANEVEFVVKAMRAFFDGEEVACIRCYNTSRGGNKATFSGRGSSRTMTVKTTVQDENTEKLSAYFYPEDPDFQAALEFGIEMGWIAEAE